jgi:hypothetical protein
MRRNSSITCPTPRLREIRPPKAAEAEPVMFAAYRFAVRFVEIKSNAPSGADLFPES